MGSLPPLWYASELKIIPVALGKITVSRVDANRVASCPRDVRKKAPHGALALCRLCSTTSSYMAPYPVLLSKWVRMYVKDETVLKCRKVA